MRMAKRSAIFEQLAIVTWTAVRRKHKKSGWQNKRATLRTIIEGFLKYFDVFELVIVSLSLVLCQIEDISDTRY